MRVFLPSSARMREPVRLCLFHDVLCAFCQVAAERLRRIEDEFGDLVEVELRPFPLRTEPASPTRSELRRQVRLVKSAAREREGASLSPALWRGIDPPHSSLPPLVAAEAARLQGRDAQRALLERMREAAFGGGVNVARRDVLLELAAAARLNMDRFVVAFDSPATLRAIENSRREAVGRGVRALPSEVIDEEGLLTGVREVHEYRDALLRWLQRRGGGDSERVLH